MQFRDGNRDVLLQKRNINNNLAILLSHNRVDI